MSARDSISIQVTIRIGEQVMKISDARPLFLSGDRRRWRRQIAEHIASQTEILGRRFDVEPSTVKPIAKRESA